VRAQKNASFSGIGVYVLAPLQILTFPFWDIDKLLDGITACSVIRILTKDEGAFFIPCSEFLMLIATADFARDTFDNRIRLFTGPDQPTEAHLFELAVQHLADILRIIHSQRLTENRSRMPLGNLRIAHLIRGRLPALILNVSMSIPSNRIIAAGSPAISPQTLTGLL
jgi:hypothetical protein